jgi:hypothetical protein
LLQAVVVSFSFFRQDGETERAVCTACLHSGKKKKLTTGWKKKEEEGIHVAKPQMGQFAFTFTSEQQSKVASHTNGKQPSSLRAALLPGLVGQHCAA